MKRILVVDDDPAIRRMTKLGLESAGAYTVFMENLGVRAVETARSCRPDLILLDIMMPDMDGSDVATALQEDPELRHIKLVFLTALLSKSQETKSGEHIVIAKPVTTQELVAIIEQELGPAGPG
ncbi:MAG: response regulator [Sulfuritalea sp.]|jgi:CheY-like chemotaxis protein|nr:response regulator [Sulfuritalea sp.]